MTTQTNGFLPDGYEAPKSGNNYFKFEKGENRVRILSRPILGWLDWKDKKPLRFRLGHKPTPVDPKMPVRHFWAMIVWNYKQECIQVMEITQATIQQAITALAKDAEWGNPVHYDIKITKSGEGMETSYMVNPSPHKQLTPDIQMAIQEKGEIKLDALYDGGDPFEGHAEAVAPVTNVDPTDDMPF